jgi:pyruvate-formate lyase-activating enzyme
VFLEKTHSIAKTTDGGMNREPMLALLEVMDAVTVDLKGFAKEFYERVSSSSLVPVLRTLETVCMRAYTSRS